METVSKPQRQRDFDLNFSEYLLSQKEILSTANSLELCHRRVVHSLSIALLCGCRSESRRTGEEHRTWP
jgi:hypothetical protein